MSEANKIVAAQLTTALITNNSNFAIGHPETIDSVTETYKKILDYLNHAD